VIDALRIFWDELTGRAKAVVVCVLILVALVAVSGWVDSWKAWRDTRALEKQAAESLEKAAKIASELVKREKEVGKLEEKRDEKVKELDTLSGGVSRDRDVYDRAVAEPRTDQPTAEQLCRELDAIGYSCYR